MPCDWTGKKTTGIKDLAYRGIDLVPLDSAYPLLVDTGGKIYAISLDLFPLLYDQAPTSKEALNYIQSYFTGDCMGAYVMPAETDIIRMTIMDGGLLFSTSLAVLNLCFPGDYAPTHMSPNRLHLTHPGLNTF